MSTTVSPASMSSVMWRSATVSSYAKQKSSNAMSAPSAGVEPWGWWSASVSWTWAMLGDAFQMQEQGGEQRERGDPGCVRGVQAEPCATIILALETAAA